MLYQVKTRSTDSAREKLPGVKNTLSILLLSTACVIVSCKSTSKKIHENDRHIFDQALENAERAQEGFVRANNYMHAWLSYADPVSKLVPRTLDKDKDIWNANDCAADNF